MASASNRRQARFIWRNQLQLLYPIVRLLRVVVTQLVASFQMSDAIYVPEPLPFWFVESELLSIALRAEIGVAARLLEDHPELPHWFDSPETESEQRKICFSVAARYEVTFNMSDTIAERYEQSEPLDEKETKTIQRIGNLIVPDAPAWVTEMKSVIERIPSHLYASLPEPLQTGRFDESSEQLEAVKALSTREQIQMFIQRVLDQQVERLSKRWSVTIPLVREYPSSHRDDLSLKKPVKRKAVRTRDKVRVERDRMIAEIDDISPTPTEFIRLMDEWDVKPLPTWAGWPGTWTKAYRSDRLRRLIHQDKYRALERFRQKK